MGEGWNLKNLGMFSSFGQIAYSLKNSVVGRPAPSVKPCQTWRRVSAKSERKGKIKKAGKGPFPEALCKTNISGLSVQIAFPVDMCLFNNICFFSEVWRR